MFFSFVADSFVAILFACFFFFTKFLPYKKSVGEDERKKRVTTFETSKSRKPPVGKNPRLLSDRGWIGSRNICSRDANDVRARFWKTRSGSLTICEGISRGEEEKGPRVAREREPEAWLTRRGQPLFSAKDNPSPINPPRKTFDLTPVLAGRESVYSQRENPTPAALSRRLPLYY